MSARSKEEPPFAETDSSSVQSQSGRVWRASIRRRQAGRIYPELIQNLVKRNSTVSQPDRVWVTDIT